MRTFVAIDIPGEIRDRIQTLIQSLRRSGAEARWSRPEGLHITLKFLGEVPSENLSAVKLALQSLEAAAPIPITIGGAGAFPHERAPRVLWLGIRAGPELGELAARVERSLLPLGIPKDDRPFSPHLTLARTRNNNSLVPLQGLLRKQEPLRMGSFTTSEFFLYESKPGAGGSIYTKIARYGIGPPTDRTGGTELSKP